MISELATQNYASLNKVYEWKVNVARCTLLPHPQFMRKIMSAFHLSWFSLPRCSREAGFGLSVIGDDDTRKCPVQLFPLESLRTSPRPGMGNLFLFACQSQLRSMAKFCRVPTDSSCFPLKISVKSKKKVFTCSDFYSPLKTVAHPGGFGGRPPF